MKYSFSLFLACLITVKVQAMGTKPVKSPSSNISLTEKINTMSIDVKEIKTPKKFSIWFVPSKDVPVITIGIGFKNAGAICVGPQKNGLVKLLTQMLQEGAGDLSSRQFKEYLLEKKIYFSINEDEDSFFITIRTVKENAFESLKILKKMLEKPLFADHDMQRVKQQLLQELEQSLHDEHRVAYKHFLKFVLKDHPYVHDIAQDIQDIPNITSDDLHKFMKDFLSKDNIIISVAGNIEENDLIKHIDENLSFLPATSRKLEIAQASQHNLGKSEHHSFPIPQSIIYFAQPSVGRNHPDFYALYLLNIIIGGSSAMFETELWDEIREKRGLAYYINTNLILYNHWSAISGKTATNTKDVEETIRIIKEKWHQIAANGVQEEQLKFQKKYLTGSFPLSFSSTSDIVSKMLGYQVCNLPVSFIKQRNQILNNVTLQDVNRVAKQYLDVKKLSFLVLGQ